MKYKNLGEMFFEKRQLLGDKTAYTYKEAGNWVEVSFKEAVDRAEKIAGGLASLGVAKGDRVAIMSANRLEWALCDYASVSLGALLVPIYPSLLSEQVRYILNDSEAKVIIVSDPVQVEKVQKASKELKFTKHFFVFDTSGEKLAQPWRMFSELSELGEAFLAKESDYIPRSIEKVAPDDWATIIYTSGTTGEPKGAILTHKNLISNIENGSAVLEVKPDDVFLSFLPLSHIFERMAGHYLSCYHGCTVGYAESVDTVAQNLLEVRPTVMVSVPRLYEKIYARVLEAVEMGPPLKRKIFYWAIKVGKEYVNKVMYHKPVPGWLNFKRNLAFKLVFKKLQDRVGGRNRFFVSGGAPLSAEIAEFFGAAGIKILEGYGLTETSPVITVNHEDSFRFGAVGHVLPNVEVKIAEDGEILTRGDHVMVGYYKKEAETKEAIDEDGWFHTGDIGLIDEDDFLKITDRKKNIIVTSGGKNIAPQPIENSLITSKFIDQIVVIGDKRKFCTAVIVPSEDALGSWAKEKNLSFSNYLELVNLPGVKELIRSEIDSLTANLASYETIKDFIFARAPFTIENDQLTPSLKVRRNVVERDYAAEIEKMYQI